jgi:hypothetical protein
MAYVPVKTAFSSASVKRYEINLHTGRTKFSRPLTIISFAEKIDPSYKLTCRNPSSNPPNKP